MNKNIVVTYSPREEIRVIYDEVLGDLADIHFLKGKKGQDRERLLESADALVALSFSQKEIERREINLLKNLRFIQLIYAGADNIPFDIIAQGVVLASNVGAFAEPIAEHVLALTLALAKNIIPGNMMLGEGRFDRTGFNREIRGGTCGIIGLGGNGREIARIMQAMGMKVYGINRSGQTDASIDFIGNESNLKTVLEDSDVVVLTTPLTVKTKDLIGKKELEWMKEDAILINVARGDVINQQDFYDHLKSHPDFRAGIDTWWSEPAERGPFEPDYPFFELPNIIGSPHCADHVPGSIAGATRKALENVKQFMQGNPIRGVLDRNDYRKQA